MTEWSVSADWKKVTITDIKPAAFEDYKGGATNRWNVTFVDESGTAKPPVFVQATNEDGYTSRMVGTKFKWDKIRMEDGDANDPFPSRKKYGRLPGFLPAAADSSASFRFDKTADEFQGIPAEWENSAGKSILPRSVTNVEWNTAGTRTVRKNGDGADVHLALALYSRQSTTFQA